ncbi:MAG: UDP-glucose/GDP-mannose dehydrogenase family protein [Candidatus Staskawiczbacteria bacterium]|nr:UDP-glucose/GDP-mannose dehydrogenase family protein [Candidatus Staskawiczbacteria bacterium]
MKISIIGAGYVGLVTGVGLASVGHEVFCVDVNEEKVKKINSGISPIYEKDLDKLLKKASSKKLISATSDLKSAVLNSDITFITVPTPSQNDGGIDLSFIKKISHQIGIALLQKNKYHLIVVKSTVVPETTQDIVIPLIEKYSKKNVGQFGVCMNPEFLREGGAVYDFMNPDRIVIGQLDKKSGDKLAEVYKNFKTDILRTSLNNAEMIKYTNNALLATLISFSNEIANICQQTPGTDAFEVLKGVHLDKRFNPILNNKRVNPNFLTYLWPGCGFGGSCFPKDVKALAAFAKKKNYNPLILSAVLDVNKKQPLQLSSLAEKNLGTLENKKIAVLGLAFKPNTDDTRESPAISLIKELISKKAKVSVYDPIVNSNNIKSPLSGLNFKFANSLDDAIKGKDACLLVTSWQEFKNITPELLKNGTKNPLLIDGRGFFDKKEFEGKTNYLPIGKNINKKNIQTS